MHRQLRCLLCIVRDLLNRHHRLSQCSNPASSIPQGTASTGQEAASPSKIIYQISPAEDAVVSPSESSHGRTPFNPDFITQTSATRNVIIGPTTAMNNNAPVEYSQKQLMGKFSIRGLDTSSQEQQSSHPARDSGVAARSDINMDNTIETGSDFTQLQLFDIDFLANETDMINGYLMDIFPPIDYQQPMIEDISDAYSGSQSLSTGLGANNLEISTLMQNEMSPLQGRAPVVQSIPSRTNQAQDSLGRSLDAIDDVVATNPWTVSAAAYEKLTAEVDKHISVLPEPFALPSRQTLSRYVASWMRSFHPHLPFIHIPTTCLEDKTPMLVLTLAATGSFYGFEHTHTVTPCILLQSLSLQMNSKSVAEPLLCTCFELFHVTPGFPPVLQIHPHRHGQRHHPQHPALSTLNFYSLC